MSSYLSPENWTAGYSKAPEFDRRSYQQKLDAIVGTARGQSIIRLVFGSEEEVEQIGVVTTPGGAVNKVMVGRYLTRVRDVPGEVRTRRWIFEEWQPPEQFAHNDPLVQIPGSGLFAPPQLAKEFRFGRWNLVYVVADHSECDPSVCSDDGSVDADAGYFCFGSYRAPNEKDLQLWRRVTAQRKEMGNVPNPFAPVPLDTVELYNKQSDDQADEDERAEQQEIDDRYEDVNKTLKVNKKSVSVL